MSFSRAFSAELFGDSFVPVFCVSWTKLLGIDVLDLEPNTFVA
jgi:hypothetical protein